MADSGHALSAPKGASTWLGVLSCSLSAQSRLWLDHAVSLCEALMANSDKAWMLWSSVRLVRPMASASRLFHPHGCPSTPQRLPLPRWTLFPDQLHSALLYRALLEKAFLISRTRVLLRTLSFLYMFSPELRAHTVVTMQSPTSFFLELRSLEVFFILWA